MARSIFRLFSKLTSSLRTLDEIIDKLVDYDPQRGFWRSLEKMEGAQRFMRVRERESEREKSYWEYIEDDLVTIVLGRIYRWFPGSFF